MTAYADIVAACCPGARLVRTWPLRGGVSAITVGVELLHDDGRRERVVVRQMGAAAFKAAAMDSRLEHDLLVALHARGLPVARPRHVD